MLDNEPKQNNMGLSIYTKSTVDGETFGRFIYIPEDLTKHPGIPDDLRRCLAVAQNHGCVFYIWIPTDLRTRPSSATTGKPKTIYRGEQ